MGIGRLEVLSSGRTHLTAVLAELGRELVQLVRAARDERDAVPRLGEDAPAKSKGQAALQSRFERCDSGECALRRCAPGTFIAPEPGRSVGHRTSHRHRGDADAPVPLPTPATTKIGRDDIAVICYLRRFAEMCLRADAVRFSTVSTGWLLYRAAQAHAARRYIRRDVASSRHAPRAPSPHWKVLSEPCELRPRADGPSRATDYQRGRLMF